MKETQPKQSDKKASRLSAPATPGYRIGFVSLLAALIGILAGFVAFALYDLIGLFTNLAFYHKFSFHFHSPSVEQVHALGLWVILIPVVGAIIIGFMAKYGSPKIKGHGIPEAMEAVIVGRSRIEGKVAILKPLSAAIAIGTGGPFGAEGPIIQTGGAFGSLVGQLVSMTGIERRVLLACGAGAGMAATFNTPIAGVILAIELLLLEFRSRSFIPLVISSVMATSVHFILLGRSPMFVVGETDFGIPSGLPFYLLLGVICGFAAIGLTKALYRVEDLIERIPIDDLWHPAIGALGLGIIGYFVPQVLGVGYNTIGAILNNTLTFKLLILIAVFKSAALMISLGAGTSGGLLAPMFMSSAALGGAFAMVVNRVVPGAHLQPGAYALVAMAAVFGAASRATFAFIVFAFEITRDYNAILPLMLGCVIADLIALRYLPNSIMTEKLARRGIHTSMEYEADVLKHVRVKDVMSIDAAKVPQDLSVREAIDRISKRDPELTRHRGLPVVDEQEHLVSFVTRADLLRVMQTNPGGDIPIGKANPREIIVAYPDERVFDALFRMLEYDIGRLPVVSRKDPRKLEGYLSRTNVLRAWTRQFEEEHVREHGWLPQFWKAIQPEDHVPERTLTGTCAGLQDQQLRVDYLVDGSVHTEVFLVPEPPEELVEGARITVFYRVENGRNVAARIESSPQARERQSQRA